MLLYLFLLFTVVPLVELTILIRIGQATEWYVPIALVILTGIIGAALARWQGTQVLRRIQDDARAGHMPADAMIDGFLILLAGILLVTPGVLTDICGCLLLIPPVRSLFKRAVAAWIKRHIEVRVGGFRSVHWPPTDGAQAPEHDTIIDAKILDTHIEELRD